MYSELFLYENFPMDVELLCQSLLEKTNLLAQGMTLPFLNNGLMETSGFQVQGDITKEEIISLIIERVTEMEDSIEKESLLLLREQVEKQTFNSAIIKGLIENIRNHPHCKWISYLLSKYFLETV